MARYAPGSFSKNFAWHGRGLGKLHSAIRLGFRSTLRVVRRDQFRATCGVDASDLQLVPINFFLHNTIREGQNHVSIDELVYQANQNPHSLAFDRLALFAFHLNRAGRRRGSSSGSATPALWAKEFVQEVLWENGAWRTSALVKSTMDDFLGERMVATTGVRTKCRSNYRHLLELCEYLPSKGPVINCGADQWGGQALFLAWDRYLMDENAEEIPGVSALLEFVTVEQIHKFLGLTQEILMEQAVPLAELYLEVGALGRFRADTGATSGDSEQRDEVKESQPSRRLRQERFSSADDLTISAADWVQQQVLDDVVVSRRTQKVQSQARERRNAVALKQLYNNCCMFCGVAIVVGRSPDRLYSEAAHIKPLGAPHNGPDNPGNMIILCPNHHIQFDSGFLRIRRRGSKYILQSKGSGDDLDGNELQLKEPHKLDDEFVNWHYSWFTSRRG